MVLLDITRTSQIVSPTLVCIYRDGSPGVFENIHSLIHVIDKVIIALCLWMYIIKLVNGEIIQIGYICVTTQTQEMHATLY